MYSFRTFPKACMVPVLVPGKAGILAVMLASAASGGDNNWPRIVLTNTKDRLIYGLTICNISEFKIASNFISLKRKMKITSGLSLQVAVAGSKALFSGAINCMCRRKS